MKIAQQTTNTIMPELISLRNSIVKFHQNMKIAYDKLKTSSTQGTIQKALLEAYKPYLENVAAAPVFGQQFTTEQLKQHMRYLEGVLKKFASINAVSQDTFAARYGRQPYYQNILYFGNKIKENFTPAATGVKSTLPDDQLIKTATQMGNVLDKVGANFVKLLTNYIGSLGPTNTLGRVISRVSIDKLIKYAFKFNKMCTASNNTALAITAANEIVKELSELEQLNNNFVNQNGYFSSYNRGLDDCFYRIAKHLTTIFGTLNFNSSRQLIEKVQKMSVDIFYDINLDQYYDDSYDPIIDKIVKKEVTKIYQPISNLKTLLTSSKFKNDIADFDDNDLFSIENIKNSMITFSSLLDILLGNVYPQFNESITSSVEDDLSLLIDKNTQYISEEEIEQLPTEPDMYNELYQDLYRE